MPIVVKNGITYDLPASQLEEAARQGYEVIGEKQAVALEKQRDARINVGQQLQTFGEAAAASAVDAAVAPIRAIEAGVRAPGAIAREATLRGIAAAQGLDVEALRRATADIERREATKVGQAIRDVTGSEGLGADVAGALVEHSPFAGVTGVATGRQLVGGIAGLAGSGGDLTRAEAAREEYDEAARARAQANQAASLAGSVAGAVGVGLLTGGGVSALAGKAAPLAARLGFAAAEGGMQGIGAADEAAWLQGRPRATAESVLASMGVGAVLGGGIAGLGELAGAGLSRLGTRAAVSAADAAAPGVSREVAEDMIVRATGQAPSKAAVDALHETLNEAAGTTATRARGGLLGMLTDTYAGLSQRVTGLGDDSTALLKRAMRGETEALEQLASPGATLTKRASEVSDAIEQVQSLKNGIWDRFGNRATKREFVESLLDAEQSQVHKAAAQAATTDALATLKEMRAAASTVRAASELDDVIGLVQQQTARAMQAADGAEAFMANDHVKRVIANHVDSLGKVSKNATKSLEYSELLGIQKPLAELSEKLRVGLEDESVWGRAGAAQRDLNEMAHATLRRGRFAEAQVLTQTGREWLGMPILDVDPGKVSAMLRKAAADGDSLSVETVQELLQNYAELGRRLGTYGADAEAGTLAAAAERAAKSIGGYVDETRAANQVLAVQRASGSGLAATIGTGLTMIPGTGLAGPAVGAGIAALTNPAQVALQVGRLLQTERHVDGRIVSGIRGFLSGARPPSEAVQGAARAGAVRGFQRRNESPQEAYERTAMQVQTYLQDPVASTERQAAVLGDMGSRFPQLTGEMQAVSARVASFLSSKMPAEPSTPRLFQPRDSTPPLSDREAEKWGRYYTAATRPLEVLSMLQSGDLRTEHVEALRACYPELYARVTHEALQQVEKQGARVSYEQRAQLDVLLGLDGRGQQSAGSRYARMMQQAAQSVAAKKPQPTRAAPSRAGDYGSTSSKIWST